MLAAVPKKPTKTRISLSGFGVVMTGVIVFVLVIFMIWEKPPHGLTPDLPEVSNARPMPHATDTMSIHLAIMRNGDVYLGSEKIRLEDLSIHLGTWLEGGAERRVYIKADANCPYGTVTKVAEAVRSAGIENIVFLADQSKPPSPAR